MNQNCRRATDGKATAIYLEIAQKSTGLVVKDRRFRARSPQPVPCNPPQTPSDAVEYPAAAHRRGGKGRLNRRPAALQ
jgi:hypothetical protein